MQESTAVTQSAPVSRVCMLRAHSARTDVRALRAARALGEAGLAVKIIDMESDLSRNSCEFVEGIAVRHIIMPSWFSRTPFKPWLLIKMFRLFATRVRLLMSSQADVYHASEWDALLPSFVASVMRIKPLVYEVYDLPFESHPRYYSSMLRKVYRSVARLMLRHVVPRCTTVIAASPCYAREMEARYGGKRLVVLRNIPEFREVPPSNRLREKYGIPPATRIALYQGYFFENRSLDRLVRAARYLSAGVVIVLMGSGPMQIELEYLIGAEGVGERVKIAAFVPHDQLLDWTASADIGLCVLDPGYSLNLVGTLPNKVFECLMAGVPVLNSLPEVGKLLDQYGAGRTIHSLDPEDIAVAINQMLADEQGMQLMRRNALAACQRELRWDVERIQLLNVYGDILGTSLVKQLGSARTERS